MSGTTFAVVIVAATTFGLVAHEGAHWAAARLLGYDAHIVVRWLGPGVCWATGVDERQIPWRHRALVAAAGPAGSVTAGAAMVAVCPRWWPVAVVVAMGVTQLIPLPHSDGSSMLRAALMR